MSILLIHTEVLDTNPLYGQDTYNGQFSKPTCAQLGQAAGCTIANDATSYNLADFIFGTPSASSPKEAIGDQSAASTCTRSMFRTTGASRPKLTLNLGLRWDFATPLYERDNNYSNFDPTTNSMVKATGGSLYNRSLVHPDYKDFGPRVGLAYSIDPKTVVRSGYGISYSFFNRPGSAHGRHQRAAGSLWNFHSNHSAGGPAPASFLTTKNSFTTGIANPSAFNPAALKRRLHSRRFQVAVHSELVLLGAAGIPMEYRG